MEGANTNTWWFDQQHVSSRVENVKLLKMPNLKIFECYFTFLFVGKKNLGSNLHGKHADYFGRGGDLERVGP